MTSSKLNSSQSFGSKTIRLLDGTFSDVRVVLSDGTSFNLHRLILAAASGYFRALFEFEAMRSSKFPRAEAKSVVPSYRLARVSKESFNFFLGWTYGHKLELCPSNVEGILIDVGGYLDCAEVAKKCVSFLLWQMSEVNVIGMKRFSKFYNVFDLQSAAHNYLTFRFGHVSKNEEFLELGLEELLELISFNDLNAEEAVVWEALVRWMNHGHSRYLRRRNLEVLIRAVRIGQFTAQYFQGKFLKDIDGISAHESKEVKAARDYFSLLVPETLCSLSTPIVTPALAIPRTSREIVLAFGGWSTGAPMNVVESFDLRADRWSILATTDPAGSRGYYSSAVIGTRIYLVGGGSGISTLRSVSSFDVVSGVWRIETSMHLSRCYVCLAQFENKLYAFGGFDGYRRMRSVETFSPKTNQWSMEEVEMLSDRSDASCAVLDGKIYVVGGFDGNFHLDTAEMYSPKTKQWYQLPRMAVRRSGAACVAYMDEIYVLGGFDGTRRMKVCEKYSPKLKRWERIPDMILPRSNFGANVVDDGKMLLVAGGYTEQGARSVVECFHDGMWYRASDMQVARTSLSIAVVSGMNLNSTVLNSFQYPNRNSLPEEKRLHEQEMAREKEYYR